MQDDREGRARHALKVYCLSRWSTEYKTVKDAENELISRLEVDGMRHSNAARGIRSSNFESWATHGGSSEQRATIWEPRPASGDGLRYEISLASKHIHTHNAATSRRLPPVLHTRADYHLSVKSCVHMSR